MRIRISTLDKGSLVLRRHSVTGVRGVEDDWTRSVGTVRANSSVGGRSDIFKRTSEGQASVEWGSSKPLITDPIIHEHSPSVSHML